MGVIVERRWIGAIVAAVALAGCSQTPDNLVVLLDQPDGRAAAVEIQTDAGAQVLDQPGQASGLDAAGQAPIAPITVDKQIVSAIFGDAFGATPPTPKLFRLYFASGAARLTPESEALLPDVFAAIDEATAPSVDVIGHTDTVGAADVNARLALKRATVIRDLLVERGLAPDLVQVDSHGEANPVVPTDDGVDEPKNRRVEVTVR